MKIKLGPVEIEQDPIKDELLYNEYKESPKIVEKYLVEKSKYFDLTLKNIIAGKTMKMIRDTVFSIAGSVAFVGWIIYVFYVSKDSFVWKEISPEATFLVVVQALLIIGICFLPVLLVVGCFTVKNKISASRKTETPENKSDNK